MKLSNLFFFLFLLVSISFISALSVDIPIPTESVTYFPTSIWTVTGINDTAENVSLVESAYDGLTFNVSEVGGVPGLEVRANFTGVADFNLGTTVVWYEGSSSHEVDICLWDYTSSSWVCDPNWQITDNSHFEIITGSVFNSENFIQGGVVQMRYYHADSGNPNHDLFIDYISITSGSGVLFSNDHDSLGGRNDILLNHPNSASVFVEVAGDTMTGTLTIGEGNDLQMGSTTAFPTTSIINFGDTPDLVFIDEVTDDVIRLFGVSGVELEGGAGSTLTLDLDSEDLIFTPSANKFSLSSTSGLIDLDFGGISTYREDYIQSVFGTGNDASIYFDATNMVINPSAVGTQGIAIGSEGGVNGDLSATGQGSLAGGYALRNAPAGSGTIYSSNQGSFAWGLSEGVFTDTFINASGSGSIAMGYARANNILSTNEGSIAMGYSTTGDIVSSGQGSIAMGGDVEATQNYAITFGEGFDNNIANTFMVGYNDVDLQVQDDLINIFGDLNVSGDVNITGTLYGGSPLDIGSNAIIHSNLTVTNETFFGDNVSISRNVTGGDVALFLKNPADSGLTTETVSLIAKTTSLDYTMGKIVFGRKNSYSGADWKRVSDMEFYTSASGGVDTLAMTIDENQLVSFENKLTLLDSLEVAGSNVDITIDSSRYAYFYIDRSDDQRFSQIFFQTAGVTDWNMGSTSSFDSGDGSEWYLGQGSEASYSMWLETDRSVAFGGDALFADNSKTFFGDASDASIYYDGGNMFINPQEQGSGGVIVTGLQASGDVNLTIRNTAPSAGSPYNESASLIFQTTGNNYPMGKIKAGWSDRYDIPPEQNSYMEFYTTLAGTDTLALTINSGQDFDFQDGDLTTTGTIAGTPMYFTCGENTALSSAYQWSCGGNGEVGANLNVFTFEDATITDIGLTCNDGTGTANVTMYVNNVDTGCSVVSTTTSDTDTCDVDISAGDEMQPYTVSDTGHSVCVVTWRIETR